MDTDRENVEAAYKELTGNVIGAAMRVANSLGHGFLENVYRKAMMVELDRRGISAVQHVPFKIRYEGMIVGDYVADIVAEQSVIVELKAVSGLLAEHRSQVINYLRASGLRVGLLFNFGRASLEYKRLIL